MANRVLKKREFKYSLFIFIFLAKHLTPSSSLQLSKKQNPSAELAYCLSSTPAEYNIKSFWHAASNNCAADPLQLIKLYETITANSSKIANNPTKCDKLLKHQLRKTLIETGSTIFEDALISATFQNNTIIERLSQRLASVDQILLHIIWEQTIDSIYLFIDKVELAQLIYEFKDYGTKVKALIYLRRKQIRRGELNAKILQKMTWCLKALKDDKNYAGLPSEEQRHILKLYGDLPKKLLQLYGSKNAVRLLNKAFWEYLYAPRDIGPDDVRRIPLTWIKEKNSTDVDGDFHLVGHDDGTFRLGSYYRNVLRYLYFDRELKEPFFWIDDDATVVDDLHRSWFLDWFDPGDYFTVTNVATGDLLCAVGEYDENRRYVSVLTADKAADHCHWFI